MKSPFPGMDPYIEACGLWEDFHNHLVEKIAETVADALPERYTARSGERTYVVVARDEGKESHLFKPDVEVTIDRPAKRPSKKKGTAAEVTDSEAVSMRAFIPVEYRETFVEIYEQDEEQRLVTCIEVLSPSNKRGSKGRKLYLRKRQALLLGEAHLVEIDLLRGGRRMPMLDPWPKSPYALLVARDDRSPYCRVWPAYYDRPLPAIPVPLCSPDSDIQLNLQPLIEKVYARFRYGRAIDYTKPLRPPLPKADVQQLRERLKARARE